MACYHPLQAVFSIRPDGKKDIKFSDTLAKMFEQGVKPVSDNVMSIPCGKCMGCRLERSRQWAIRCMHESKLYEDNCFVTLTFSPQGLYFMSPDGSLSRRHVQLFMKSLRKKFSDRKIRVFYCGEYGDKLGRPHYHLCLFNLDFPDKKYWRSINGFKLYNSGILSDLWPYGHSVIGSLTFESAAYVARYCTKKITGKLADEHYGGRLPEFAQASLKPGIASDWIDQFGKTDVFPFDEVVVRGARCKPPRFYDKVRERVDPEGLAKAKAVRVQRALERADDNSFRRLAVREKCQEARFKKLIRILEK